MDLELQGLYGRYTFTLTIPQLPAAGEVRVAVLLRPCQMGEDRTGQQSIRDTKSTNGSSLVDVC